MNELVTVIITTKNRKKLLERAVNSVYNQTYKNIELIIIDDSSIDETRKYCLKNNLNYIYISPEESKGGNYARNIGVKNSKGTLIAFLDDDDYWIDTKIEKQVRVLNNNIGFVYCGIKREVIDRNKITYVEKLCDEYYSGDVSKKILTKIFTTTSCILIRKNILINIGLFDEKISFWQEYELSIRVAQETFFDFVNEPLVIYRIDKNDKNRLTNKFFGWYKAVFYIYNKHIELYRKLNIIEYFKYLFLLVKETIVRIKNITNIIFY